MSWLKKNNTILLLIGLILTYNFGDAQNFIKNGGFEKGDKEGARLSTLVNQIPNPSKTYYTADFLEKWKRRQANIAGNPDKTAHSPDWSYEGTIIYPSGFNINGFPPIEQRGMLGMSIYELIQQKFDKNGLSDLVQNQNIIGNPNIKLSFQVRLAREFYEEVSLNVYLAKNKLKYKSDNVGNLDYYKIEGNSNFIVAGLTTNLESQFSVDEWRKYELLIPYNTLIDYKWIGIGLEIDESYHEQLRNGNHNNTGYLRIDDVQLTLDCEDTCSRIDGEQNVIVSSNVIHNNSSVVIENLENITNLKFQAWLSNNQLVYENEINCPNGIDHPIYWDGKSLFGADMANAQYTYTITATNDCYTKEWKGAILKLQNYLGTNNSNFDQGCLSGGNITPEECCHVDFYIDNQTLIPPPFSKYIVQENIWACTKVPDFSDEVLVLNGAKVLFQAGDQITLAEGFNTEMGAVFCAQIAPRYCDGITPKETKTNTIIDLVSNEEKERKKEDEERDVKDIKLYPNPTNGLITIETSFKSGNYIIIDFSGNQVFSGQIEEGKSKADLNNNPSGFYTVIIYDEEKNIHYKKIIKQ